MNVHNLLNQWDHSVQALQEAIEDHAQSELHDAALQVRTALSAGADWDTSWRDKGDNVVCRHKADDTYECQSCTRTWTNSPC